MLDTLQRYEEALTAYNQAIQLNPFYTRAWYNKGITLWGLQRYDEALAAYEQAITLNPRFADAWYNKGVVLNNLERNKEACAAFDKVMGKDKTITLNPQDVEYYEEALAAYEKVGTLNPQDADVWYKKGIVLDMLERREEALATYTEVINLNSQYQYVSTWSSGKGKNVSPELVSDKFPDAEVVILLHGTNILGNEVYSYVKLLGSDLKKMIAAMRTGENFKPTAFGMILVEGTGNPPQEIRDKMKEEYNMTDVPLLKLEPAMQPKSFDDENK